MVSVRLQSRLVQGILYFFIGVCVATSATDGQVGPPADSVSTPDVLPPCCTTPAIIEALSARPAAESRERLAAWLDDRARRSDAATIDRELAALQGACETGCPANFQVARGILREWRSRMQDSDDHGEPCCEPVPAPAVEARRAQSVRTIVAVPRPIVGGPRFNSEILRQLLGWEREPDEVP